MSLPVCSRSEMVFTVDKNRLKRRLGAVSAPVLQAIGRALADTLDLPGA